MYWAQDGTTVIEGMNVNIIYMLENVDKKEGRRFYIGSKQECQIEVVDGLNRIVSCKTGRLYYGSSTCLEMKADMQSLIQRNL